MSNKAWTKLVRFKALETGKVHLGQPVDLRLDVGLELLKGAKVVVHEISGASALDPTARVTQRKLTVSKLLSPLTREDIGIVRCLGLNYTDHAAEAKMPLPDRPNLFYKPTSVIIGPNEPIVIPRVAQPAQEVLPDYEVELVIVVGKDAKDVPVEKANDYILGFTAGNDVSFRKHQLAVTQWGFSKSFDDTTPLGPCIVSASAIDSTKLGVKTILNGQIRQDGTTANLVFDAANVVSYLSQGTTLKAGTVIYTGTPKGVGAFANPKVFLKDGDHVHVWVEHIGTLANPVIEEGQAKARL
ncbi:hypothetical protein FRC01_011314 [Tulasnella sp. 417]|nr:hypothetical protein FRC01_011314 [Tulasnella sp. 417]